MSDVSLDPDKVAAINRQQALADLDDWFQEQIEQGFATADGWKLGLAQADVTLLTGNYVLAKESAALGGPIPPVIDRDGVPHEIEAIEELTAIMLGYGQHRAALSTEYATKRAAILEG